MARRPCVVWSSVSQLTLSFPTFPFVSPVTTTLHGWPSCSFSGLQAGSHLRNLEFTVASKRRPLPQTVRSLTQLHLLVCLTYSVRLHLTTLGKINSPHVCNSSLSPHFLFLREICHIRMCYEIYHNRRVLIISLPQSGIYTLQGQGFQLFCFLLIFSIWNCA